MSKKKKIDSTGSSFKTEGIDIDTILEQVNQEFFELSFDPHHVTAIIIKFGKMLTGIPLYRYQEKMAYRIIYAMVTLEGATVTMLLSRQSGKTECLAFVINALSVLLPAIAKMFPELDTYAAGLKIGLFAPQSDQVFNTYNRALLRLNTANAQMIMSDIDLQVELYKPSKYNLTNGSEMTGQVASKQSKIEGSSYHLVICEEAQDIDSYIVQKSIEPMVSAYNGTIIKCGTTGTTKNDFWTEIQYNRNLSRKEKDARLHLHWEFNYKVIFVDKRYQYEIDKKIFHLFYESDVTKKLAKWGRESQAFKLSFALEWDLDSGMLVNDKQWAKMLNRKKGLNQFTEDDIIVAGIDLGKSINSTVITLGKLIWDPDDEDAPVKKEVIAWVELVGLDYEQQHHMIVDVLQQYMVTSVTIDYTGVGKAVVDRLEYAIGEYININQFTFSKQSKSDMWYNFLQHIDSGRLIIPANKQAQNTTEFQHFEEQLLNMVKWYDGAYLCAEKGDGYFDDYGDSLALMLLSDNIEAETEIEVDAFNPFFEERMTLRNFTRQNKM